MESISLAQGENWKWIKTTSVTQYLNGIKYTSSRYVYVAIVVSVGSELRIWTACEYYSMGNIEKKIVTIRK